jgi:DNA gyrase/topoisomerase IV subunit A
MIKEPKYEFVLDENEKDIPPIRRKINKTMEITESFNYEDTERYVQNMEKEIEGKKKEIESMQSLVEAYREEMKIIDEKLGVNKAQEEYQREIEKENLVENEDVIVSEEVIEE